LATEDPHAHAHTRPQTQLTRQRELDALAVLDIAASLAWDRATVHFTRGNVLAVRSERARERERERERKKEREIER
jgi:hypothetical protein